MNDRKPIVHEQYEIDANSKLNFVVYKSTTGVGNDEVLQHKLHGTEMAHVTLHPGDQVNLRKTRDATLLIKAIKDRMVGVEPAPSERLRQFIEAVKDKI